jgi:hypothetical protein
MYGLDSLTRIINRLSPPRCLCILSYINIEMKKSIHKRSISLIPLQNPVSFSCSFCTPEKNKTTLAIPQPISVKNDSSPTWLHVIPLHTYEDPHSRTNVRVLCSGVLRWPGGYGGRGKAREHLKICYSTTHSAEYFKHISSPTIITNCCLAGPSTTPLCLHN